MQLFVDEVAGGAFQAESLLSERQEPTQMPINWNKKKGAGGDRRGVLAAARDAVYKGAKSFSRP